jgi:hypothetical protein
MNELSKQALVKMEEISQSLTDRASSLEVTNNDQLQYARAFLDEVEAAITMIHFFCDPFVSERHTAWVSATGIRKKYLQAPEAVWRSIRGKVQLYLTAQKKAKQEAEASLSKVLAGEKVTPEEFHKAESMATTLAAPPAPAAFKTRTEVIYVVEDFSKVPDNFKLIDDGAVKVAIRHSGMATMIPGIRFEERVIPVRG